MTLRVLHAATHQHNIGDGALVAGMHATLREDLDAEIQFVPIDVLDHKLRGERTMLHPERYAEMEPSLDLVIVGGGGMIEGNKGSFRSGINFNFNLSILEQARVPWVFYALGYNVFRGKHVFHRRRLHTLIELTRDRGWPFTVRNDGSADRLQSLFPDLPMAETIPDPGLWVPEGRPDPSLNVDDRLTVILQLAGDNRRRRVRRGRRFLDELRDVVVALSEEHGAIILLTPHLLTDLPLYAELVERIPERIVRQSCRLGPVVVGAEQAADFFQRYRQADLSIGMRGHSVICSTGCLTPAIGLGSHDKIDGFFHEVGLDEWCVDVRSPTLAGDVLARVGEILTAPEAAGAKLATRVQQMREETRAFHRRIAELL